MALLLTALWTVVLPIGAWTLYCSASLLRNYLIARAIGLPVRILPVDHVNPMWVLLDRKILAFVRPLIGETNFTRYNYRYWEVDDRTRSHDELGEAFILCTPGRNWLYLASPDVLAEVYQRRTDFPRCLELTEVLNVFGPNISTIDGPQWQLQRRLTASCFNEQTNQVVWSESLSQARDLIRYWASKTVVPTIAPDIRTLTLDVLTRAGFGKTADFEGYEERIAKGAGESSDNYRDVLNTILENCFLIMAMGPDFIVKARAWLPQNLQRLADACQSFKKYMTEMYEEEKQASAQRGGAQSRGRNLMSALVRASQEESKTGKGLTEQEIYGNMFVFSFAGHDTTAHTFTFALYFLAASPEVQDWVSEELQELAADSSDWSYSNFARLPRCRAIMYETIRLYTPVPVAKWTGPSVQPLKLGNGKTITVPANTMVIPSYAHLQVEAKYWGPDALVWRPQRWIKPETVGQPGKEELIAPQRFTFLGWSEGVRECPGRKFSQVEFVATIAILFRDWQVTPQPLDKVEEGEPARARERVLNQIKTDTAPVLLIQMLHPERSPLVWKKR